MIENSPASRTAIRPTAESALPPSLLPRSVLLTTDPVGGAWSFVLELARGLVRSEVDVVVASLGGPVSASQRNAFDQLGPRASLHVDTRKLEWMEDPWDDVASSGEWLLDLEHRHRPDLVHLSGYAHAALAWRAPVLVTAHSCVYSWWRAVHRSKPPAAWRTYHAAVERGLRSADLVVAPSHSMLRSLTMHYAELPRTRMIPNGRSSRPTPGLRRRPAILGVGRLWDEAKNLRALAALAPRLPWPVRLAGAIRSPDGATAELSGCELLGVLPEHRLGAEYARAGIFAAPARYEPFGLSVLEAAQSGCALVLGDIRSLRENWDGAALFVPPDDPDALLAALLELIARPSLRRRLSVESTRRGSALSSNRMCDAYLDAYARLLARFSALQARASACSRPSRTPPLHAAPTIQTTSSFPA